LVVGGTETVERGRSVFLPIDYDTFKRFVSKQFS